ncbi:MAG: DinB family protein [Planctomycetota bacterium]
MLPAVLKELFAHDDWARDKLFALCDGLSDAQLDRPFEMGLGSLRNTLHHIWAAERVWLDRWTVGGQPAFIFPEAGLPLATLLDRAKTTAAERDALLARSNEADLRRPLAFTNIKGESYSLPLGGQMHHVANHGIHHRAQAVNMLRHLGVALPTRGLDYIFFRLENQAKPALELEAVRYYQAYADWGTRTLLDIAAKLTDAQLDQPFEMGLGTLRKTLVHLRDAEVWWHTNWTSGPAGGFPAVDATLNMADLSASYDAAWRCRDAFAGGLKNADMQRPVTVKPRPDLTLQFPLGVSMVQLCGHATHHRAQAVNMLRHVGVQPPGLDLILWLRDHT